MGAAGGATATGLVPPNVDIVADLTDLREGAVELVDTMVREVAGRAAEVEVRPVAVEDKPVHALLDAAEQNDAQMIVVGSRGHGGFVALLVGSTSEQVARHAACPVVIHRARRS